MWFIPILAIVSVALLWLYRALQVFGILDYLRQIFDVELYEEDDSC